MQEPCEDAISRAEALKAINEMDIPEDMCVFEIKSHIGVKIGVLPPVTPQLCGDAIDRDEAIKIASGYCHFSNVAKELAKLPPVTVEPEIVCCSQCKYAEVADSEDSQDGYTCQFHRGSIWFSGSYCSWAERRQDG